MPVCCFNMDFDKVYDCRYELKDGHIEIEVDDYDIMDEVEAVNGIKTLGGNTKFEKRDIFIVDFNAKKNLQVKQAFYAGANRVFGSRDGGAKTKFRASVFFEHKNEEELKALPSTPKISKIKVFSKTLIDWIGYPCLDVTSEDSALTYKLSRECKGDVIPVNSNGIKQITVADDWYSSHSVHEYNITIDFKGYIEIELMKRVNYDSVYEYIYELLIFMQLYCPDRFKPEKVYVMVNDTYYRLHMPWQEVKLKETRELRTVEVGLLDFLKECYSKIPFRKSNSEIRNIPYIVLKTSRGLEDNFLMFYRFIECFYKKTSSAGQKRFISLSISEHYASKHNLIEEQIENYAQEIICLRNRYVHAGYYIKNDSLKISFERIDGRKNPKDYTANNVDVDWIYERTFLLYQVVIDIIYKNMLGYDSYRFLRHF